MPQFLADREPGLPIDFALLGRLMQDSDGDGVGDFHDNAIHVPNADQRDTDGDGHGNIVDADFDQSGLVDFFDLAQFENRFFTQDPDADLNGDAIVDFFDLAILEGLFYQAPGASYVDAAPAAPMDITPLILLGMAEGAGAGMEGLA
ncbi:MAG: hypothetical protein JNM97_00805 [Rhodoferax sp.]|nr:hypothetical protein [Rhodoferax sp.]